MILILILFFNCLSIINKREAASYFKIARDQENDAGMHNYGNSTEQKRNHFPPPISRPKK